MSYFTSTCNIPPSRRQRLALSGKVISLGLIVLLPVLLNAQEPLYLRETRVGVGVTISDIKELMQILEGGGILPIIFVPINVSPTLRIEPGIGYYQSSTEDPDYESSSKGLSLGIGIFPMTLRGGMNLYYGARLGRISTTSSYKYDYNGGETDEESGTGLFIAPTFGGEYFLSSSFTLGGEAQLRYVSLTEKDDDEERTTSSISTRGLLFIRFYF
ncbi:MAG: hypothetical protein JSU77_04385 [Fidelibacterota bacterium]|nr:MAG: hypothetical protein JSU77_04385 [Candidatus Neomarinimicrobiota bacterium]